MVIWLYRATRFSASPKVWEDEPECARIEIASQREDSHPAKQWPPRPKAVNLASDDQSLFRVGDHIGRQSHAPKKSTTRRAGRAIAHGTPATWFISRDMRRSQPAATRYLNEIFVSGAATIRIGPLLITAAALRLLIPVAAIVLFGRRVDAWRWRRTYRAIPPDGCPRHARKAELLEADPANMNGYQQARLIGSNSISRGQRAAGRA